MSKQTRNRWTQTLSQSPFWTFHFQFHFFENHVVLIVFLQHLFLFTLQLGNSLVDVVVIERFASQSTFPVTSYQILKVKFLIADHAEQIVIRFSVSRIAINRLLELGKLLFFLLLRCSLYLVSNSWSCFLGILYRNS